MKTLCPKTLAARLLLVLLAPPAAVQAQFNYTTDNGQITITGYNCSDGAATIPSTINGLPVTTIGNVAFRGCIGLTSVTLPNSVSTIEPQAFADCTGLTSVTIPNSVTTIEDRAFFGCTGLTSATIGKSVTTIGYSAFSGCTGLKAIEVNALNPAYSSLDGVLFSKNRTMLLKCPEGKTGDYTLPNSITTIGDWAFSGCAGLTSVTIGNSLTTIGYHTFRDCTGLTSVTIGNSVTTIRNDAFSRCTGLTSVVLPHSVTTIEGEAFSGCTGLTNVTIPNSVTTIGISAFASCTGLTSVTMPNSLTFISPLAFSGCTGLKAIEVNALNPAYSSLDGVLFAKDRTKLIAYPGGKAGNYTLPESVATIGDWAFSGWPGLTGVTIPNSVTTIGNYAFSGCTGLAGVMIPNSVTTIEEFAFEGCIGLTSVTIPYSVTTIGWFTFSDCTGLTGVYFQGDRPDSGLNIFFQVPGVAVYYLAGTTGWDAVYDGHETAVWSFPLIQSNGPGFGVGADGFGFLISWAPDAAVVVEASSGLGAPVWTPVGTNTLTGGSSQFTDPQWTNHPTRLYRVRSR